LQVAKLFALLLFGSMLSRIGFRERGQLLLKSCAHAPEQNQAVGKSWLAHALAAMASIVLARWAWHTKNIQDGEHYTEAILTSIHHLQELGAPSSNVRSLLLRAVPGVFLTIDARRASADVSALQRWLSLWNKLEGSVRFEEADLLDIVADALIDTSDYEATGRMLRGKVRQLLAGKTTKVVWDDS
jgi:hypothetical protein